MKPFLLLLAAALPQFAQVKLPAYQTEILSNGAVVIWMPREGTPLIHFRVLVRGGIESDPPKMAGLQSVTHDIRTEISEYRCVRVGPIRK